MLFNLFVLVVQVFAIALIVWQLVTGKFLDGGWRVVLNRKESPILFWCLIVGQCLIVAFWSNLYLHDWQ